VVSNNEYMSAQPTILVVDDERELADLYAMWVGEDYEVVTAYDGSTALERMSDAIDIVLLDRHMPDITGDRVLEEIRATGYDCWVLMVTAVDPGLDIVELDIDDYLTKPVTRTQLGSSRTFGSSRATATTTGGNSSPSRTRWRRWRTKRPSRS